MEPIVPLLVILVQIERLLAENNQNLVTAKVIVLATVKEGARTIVSWVDDFIFSPLRVERNDSNGFSKALILYSWWTVFNPYPPYLSPSRVPMARFFTSLTVY